MLNEDVFTLAHLTDVHLGPLPPFWPRHWNVKRLLGFVNFHSKRRAFNDPALVDALTADLARQTVDHVAVTGDLANIGMPSEHRRALAWLQRIGTPDEVTVIPGNHDIYAPLRRDPGVERWRAYMLPRTSDAILASGLASGPASEPAAVPGPLATGFPFVRTFGRFALICLNSAVPTPPGKAHGTVGPEQLDRFAAVSQGLRDQRFTRIVLIHHAPLPEHGRRGLTDASEFERILLDVGCEFVLHGHNHRHMVSWRETATGPAIIIGAGAAAEGAYNLYRFHRQEAGRVIVELVQRFATRTDLTFTERRRLVFDPAESARETVL